LATWRRVTSPPWPRPRPSRLPRSSPRNRRPGDVAPASEPAAIPTSAPAAATEPATSAQPAAATEQTAIEPAVAPDPLAALDPADRAVAEKIRDLLATRGDKLFTAKKEREAVEAFYQNRNLAPLWLDKGIANARAEAVIARMKNADADGLEPGDYKAPSFSGLAPMRWPRPSSGSPAPCSPMPATCRPGASPIPA
jgi:murein L,D-transpeptidase YcbB/YkuD